MLLTLRVSICVYNHDASLRFFINKIILNYIMIVTSTIESYGWFILLFAIIAYYVYSVFGKKITEAARNRPQKGNFRHVQLEVNIPFPLEKKH